MTVFLCFCSFWQVQELCLAVGLWMKLYCVFGQPKQRSGKIEALKLCLANGLLVLEDREKLGNVEMADCQRVR